MRRRELMLLLIGATSASSAAAAQQKATRVIGFLGGTSPGPLASAVAAFRQGLSEMGYVEGQNVAIEYRWAEGRYDRLPQIATDLVGRWDRDQRRLPAGAHGKTRNLRDPDCLCCR